MTFIQALSLYHFNLKYYVYNKISVFGYTSISKFLDKMILDQSFFNYIFHKNLEFSNSDIS